MIGEVGGVDAGAAVEIVDAQAAFDGVIAAQSLDGVVAAPAVDLVFFVGGGVPYRLCAVDRVGHWSCGP